MSDTILSVRINEELKEKFIKLAQEAGVNNKEFMEQVVSHYELNSAAKEESYFKSDISELQELTRRINDIYINMIDKIKVKELEVKSSIKEAICQKDTKLDELNEIIEKYKEKDETIKSLKSNCEELKKKMRRFEEDNENLKNINLLLKDKYSHCETEIKNLQKKADDYDLLKSDFKTLKKELEESKNLVSSLLLKNEAISADNTKLKLDFEKETAMIKDKFETAVEIQKEKNNLEINTVKVTLKEEYSEKIQNLKNEYNERIMKLMQEKEEYIIKFNTIISTYNKEEKLSDKK